MNSVFKTFNMWKDILFDIAKQAKAIECKERHQILSHNPCGSLNDLCF